MQSVEKVRRVNCNSVVTLTTTDQMRICEVVK